MKCKAQVKRGLNRILHTVKEHWSLQRRNSQQKMILLLEWDVV
jgi:hypothetical protein